MRLYFDNCCFNRPFDDQNTLTIRLETEAKLHIQNAIRAGQYTLGWSYILDYENAANPLEERRIEIQRWEALADSYVAETPAVLAMMKDAEIKVLGFEVLTQHLGLVEAERFIALIQREKFDYTQWRQTLFTGLSGEELSRQAMQFRQKKLDAAAPPG